MSGIYTTPAIFDPNYCDPRVEIERLPTNKLNLFVQRHPMDAVMRLKELCKQLDEKNHIIAIYERGLIDIEQSCDERIEEAKELA